MLMIGTTGPELTARERDQLRHECVAGVVLFARNYESPEQLQRLVGQLRDARPDDGFVISVDQEGGPVQRFREGFTRLPALAGLGRIWDDDRERAAQLALEHGWLMATEMLSAGIDLSFAPVLDLARGNEAIGVRALHRDPDAVGQLGQAYIRGMHRAGMAVTIKHYPGHGSIKADTHKAVAIDDRPLATLRHEDLVPFVAAVEQGVEAVMMAHVTYPQVDAASAGQSSAWIRDILRTDMGFGGIVISDDISMAAALTAGSVAERIKAHYDAGCNIILACQPDVVDEALTAVESLPSVPSCNLGALRGTPAGVLATGDISVTLSRPDVIDHLRVLDSFS